MNRKYIAAMALCIIVVAMSLSGCLGSQIGSSSGTVTQAKVVVNYNGTWSGNIVTLGDLKNISGTGHQEYTINRGSVPLFVVFALAHKGDASDATLTVSIENMNGTVIKSESTSAANGVASVSANIS